MTRGHLRRESFPDMRWHSEDAMAFRDAMAFTEMRWHPQTCDGIDGAAFSRGDAGARGAPSRHGLERMLAGQRGGAVT